MDENRYSSQNATEGLRERGVHLLKQGRPAEAIDSLEEAHRREPGHALGAFSLALALQAVGRHREAIPLFEAARRQAPGDAAPHLHTAVSHLALADARAALTAASEACHCAPQAPNAHYVYGQAWAALGEPARAERAFAEALKLAPSWADAWVNYGVAHYRQGRVDEATTAMRQALAADPEHEAAAANLGAFLRIAGDTAGAEALLAALVARKPGAVGARLNLVADLLQEERADEALALLDDAFAPADPAVLRHWRLQQALAHLQRRQPAPARAALDALDALGPVPPALAPLWRWRLCLLAVLDGDEAGAEREAGAMEAALAVMGPDAVPEHAIMAHYDLAKFWSSRDRNARAFDHWREGHRQLARSEPFSREAHRAFVDATIARFSRDRLARGPKASNRDPAPVFVVGMPRSGTTLIEQILAAHAKVHGAGERAALGQAFHRLYGGLESGAPGPDGPALDAAADAYLAQLHALAPGAARIVDKMPANFLHLGLVAQLLPGARIIHCVRDPRDIGLSIFTFRFHGRHGYAHDLRDLGWYIGEHDRLMAHWREALPNPILTVRLADWVEDFDATLARVLAHLDLPPDANCARFYEQDSRVRTVSRGQVRQPVNARGLGRWRAYEASLAPLVDELRQAGSLKAWV